jgi:putative serine/threonine protein kinase
VDEIAGYPAGEIKKELESLGIVPLEGGPFLYRGHRILGRGRRGVVFRGTWKGGEVALKVLRSDSARPDTRREFELTRLANSVGVGPQVFERTKRVIVMELVHGVPLRNHTELSHPELERCVKESLEQASRLDALGLDHGELSRAHSHVVFTERGAKIIDFDSASVLRKPHNFNSLYSFYYMAGSALSERIKRIGFNTGLAKTIRSQRRS